MPVFLFFLTILIHKIKFSGLLHKEPGFRLGCRRVGRSTEGAEELKAHSFFLNFDFKTGREPIPWKKMEGGKVICFILKLVFKFNFFKVLFLLTIFLI